MGIGPRGFVTWEKNMGLVLEALSHGRKTWGLVLEALAHDFFFLYKRTASTLPISFFTPSNQARK